jgi:histone-lysine N-methyltransferase SETD2
LDRLPIPNKNILTDTKILQSVNKWAESTNLTPLLLNDNDNDNVLNDQESVVISEADCSNQEQEAAVAEVTAGSETIPHNDDGQPKEDSNIVTASDGNNITAGDDSNIIMSGGDTKTSDHIGRDHVEDSSSEAEPRESDKQQDEISRKDVITMALGLLDKWSSLKEVFRIPKIVQVYLSICVLCCFSVKII